MPTIREVRESKNLSQVELAAAAGVSASAIGRMESGEPVNKSTVRLVCQVLEISPKDVTGVNIVNRVKRTA